MRRQPQGRLSDPPDGKSQADAARPTGRQPGEKPGVLVVDDDHLVRVMVQLALERSDFRVWLATNGQDAINIYREHREHISVVLLDVHMAGLDGRQTLGALRRLDPKVPACMMSGDTAASTSAELVQCSDTYVIAKPFLLDDLAKVLRLLVQGIAVDPITSGNASRKSTQANGRQGDADDR